ncbi:MAG TPA: hypothetical protein VMU57_17410, partial [Edaphobacter sp.]|uniref:hypothetical protein n=1 Tax=Edaphobacter sp. TaxID=1934404 RepID=UPI002CBB8FEA
MQRVRAGGKPSGHLPLIPSHRLPVPLFGPYTASQQKVLLFFCRDSVRAMAGNDANALTPGRLFNQGVRRAVSEHLVGKEPYGRR